MSDFIDINAKLEDIIHDTRNEEIFKNFLEDLRKEGWTYFDLHYYLEIKQIDKKLYYTVRLPLTRDQEQHFYLCKDISEDNITNLSQSVDTLLEWLLYKLKLKVTLVENEMFDQDHNIKKSYRKYIDKNELSTGFVYNIYLD